MLICRPGDYRKANYQQSNCHNYLTKNIENINVNLLRIELLNSMKTQSITIPEFRITFYLYPIGILKTIIQVSCKWIKIAYTNMTKKSSAINHFFSIPPLLYHSFDSCLRTRNY
ncbi:MAG: hypothetical protein Ct9H300mP28_11990 [Pseudomonadota bacterium]|nr:MAG: hypothetical protein Ct9H300mP28_11990 [Pseudomonadota bacterium]